MNFFNRRHVIPWHMLLSGVLLFSTNNLKAQDFRKVPTKISIEAGYRFLPSTTFDMKTHGATLLLDYAWQLSGFTGKPAAYISVPLGYTYLFGGNGSKTGRILSYGWTVKHDLAAGKSTIPFFGYGLLLNQLSLQDTEGQVFGHQTRFDFGFLFMAVKKLNPYVKVEYSFTRYPRLEQEKSDVIHALELKGGVRF